MHNCSLSVFVMQNSAWVAFSAASPNITDRTVSLNITQSTVDLYSRVLIFSTAEVCYPNVIDNAWFKWSVLIAVVVPIVVVSIVLLVLWRFGCFKYVKQGGADVVEGLVRVVTPSRAERGPYMPAYTQFHTERGPYIFMERQCELGPQWVCYDILGSE
jgi:hypothetical protein